MAVSGDAAAGAPDGLSEVRCRKHQPHIGDRGDDSGARTVPEVAGRRASTAGAIPIASNAADRAQERALIGMAEFLRPPGE